MPRIFPPLSPIHPLVRDQTPCWICNRPFMESQRVVLVPIETAAQTGSSTVDAKVVHATCRLRGTRATWWDGDKPVELIVDRVKDGDASPFAIETTDGRQWKDDEIELADWANG